MHGQKNIKLLKYAFIRAVFYDSSKNKIASVLAR